MLTMYIYVVDEEQHIKGVLDINELLQADSSSKLEEIMTRNVVTVSPTTMRAKVESLLRRYRFRAIPVVDESDRIVGVIREGRFPERVGSLTDKKRNCGHLGKAQDSYTQ